MPSDRQTERSCSTFFNACVTHPGIEQTQDLNKPRSLGLGVSMLLLAGFPDLNLVTTGGGGAQLLHSLRPENNETTLHDGDAGPLHLSHFELITIRPIDNMTGSQFLPWGGHIQGTHIFHIFPCSLFRKHVNSCPPMLQPRAGSPP